MPYTRQLLGNIAIAALMILPAHTAQACQLVCITTPYNLSGAADTTAARAAACTAEKAGFKPAVEGMFAALPGDLTPFMGAKNGPSCGVPVTTTTTVSGGIWEYLFNGLAHAIYEGTPSHYASTGDSFLYYSGFGKFKHDYDKPRYFPGAASSTETKTVETSCSSVDKLVCCNM